jgi:hypothetical protein
MTKCPDTTRWGGWIIERAWIVGFRFYTDLARAVGCHPLTVSRWSRMSEVPNLQYRTRQLLAEALKLPAFIVDSQWRFCAPDSELFQRSNAGGGK